MVAETTPPYSPCASPESAQEGPQPPGADETKEGELPEMYSLCVLLTEPWERPKLVFEIFRKAFMSNTFSITLTNLLCHKTFMGESARHPRQVILTGTLLMRCKEVSSFVPVVGWESHVASLDIPDG